MSKRIQIAIVGSGPGGLSAAGRAAELGLSHVLLERTDHLSDTIFKYQKGKHVMATPDVLPLRSSNSFQAGTREAVLGAWDDETRHLQGLGHAYALCPKPEHLPACSDEPQSVF